IWTRDRQAGIRRRGAYFAVPRPGPSNSRWPAPSRNSGQVQPPEYRRRRKRFALCECAGLNWRSQAQTRVAEKSRTECGVSANGVQSVFGDVADRVDAAGAQVASSFEITPAVSIGLS